MPTPEQITLGDNPSLGDITDYVIKLQRDYTWLLQNLDDLNVKRIRADSIYTGTLDANVVTIRSDLSGSAYVQIDGDGMRINNGAYNTFEADLAGNVTMTSARIRSASGYPYVEMNYNSNLIGAYSSADDRIEISPTSDTTIPEIRFVSGDIAVGYINADDDFTVNSLYGLNLSSGTGPVYLSTMSIYGIRFDSWSEIRSISESQSLRQALDDIIGSVALKATTGYFTDSAGPFNGGITPGTQLATTSDGTTVSGSVTWVGITAHSHQQV